MRITFLGATETVTGSKYLVEHEGVKILVDCGLFQGLKELRLRNWERLPLSAAGIDAVLLTHAHIDHSGYIPLLVKQGFRGKIFCSEATRDLCAILLPDSGYLQEEDAARANRYGYTRHQPALPLYTEKEAKAALEYFSPVGFGTPHALGEGLRFTLSRSGHILGSAFITLTDGDRTVVFSGDLGRARDPILKPPAELQHADYILVESTYGDRLHAETDPAEQIRKIVVETAARGGAVIIPAFAVGRAQNILYYLHRLRRARTIPDLPIFLDSPMAINATNLLLKHAHEHMLSPEECRAVCGVATYVHTVEESKRILASPMPSVIISASGMATGGRVLHHLKHYLPDTRSTVLLSGFQAAGTRGDRLLRGEKEIKIHGEMVPVRARIMALDNASAHADYEEVLAWLGKFRKSPRKVFITHGEKEAAVSLRAKIEERFGWNAIVPTYLHSEEL